MRRFPQQTAILLLIIFASAGAAESYTAPEPAEPIQPPPYPAAALEESFEGECRVGLLISGDGSVSEAWIVQTSGREDIDLASIEAAKDTRWNPATLNGVPVSSRLAVPFTFELGILPGDPLAPVATESVEEPEISEPVLELRPRRPVQIDYLPIAGDSFAIVGLEVDKLGLALKAWIIRPSGNRAADEMLLDSVYSTLWKSDEHENELSRGIYIHVFREDATVTATDTEEEEPMDEQTIGPTGGACAFDQLEIGKYGRRK